MRASSPARVRSFELPLELLRLTDGERLGIEKGLGGLARLGDRLIQAAVDGRTYDGPHGRPLGLRSGAQTPVALIVEEDLRPAAKA
jgi:hypothetical protein